MQDPDSNDDDLQRFEAFERLCGAVWSRTKPFWIAVLIAWVVIMVVCYL